MPTVRLNNNADAPTLRAAQVEGAHVQEVLLGRYRVLARCGTGGFGTVCVCWDTRLQRRVAIKRIPLTSSDEHSSALTSTMDEALGEARMASLLSHPNIVTVFDFETDGVYAYLVMEYVDGINLAELLSRVEGGTLTRAEAAHVLVSVNDALSYAHENGVLHLDIKPTNIMIDRTGTVKLADFGMATLASASGYGDARGGTVGYMPPEQLQGMLVDERSDVFSLAVVMWQALTGKDPFASSTAKNSLDKIMRGPHESIGKTVPELAGDASDAFFMALSYDAAQRPISVEDFSEAVLPSLGNPDHGQASFAHLVGQSEEEPVFDTELWEGEHVPFLDRYPWAEGLFERTLAALVSLLAFQPLAQVLLASREQGSLVGMVVVALVSALWPPLGSALVGGALAFSLATVLPTPASFPFAAVIAVALLLWWGIAGRQDFLATPAFLMPIVAKHPYAGILLAGFAMHPFGSFVAGFGSYLFYQLFQLSLEFAFSAQGVAWALWDLLKSPSLWSAAFLSGICAALVAAITEQGSILAGIIAQILGAAGIIALEMLVTWVENGGIWVAPGTDTVALAVTLCLLLCLATALRGPLIWDQEGE